jgi:putative ABC transport system permease protein
VVTLLQGDEPGFRRAGLSVIGIDAKLDDLEEEEARQLVARLLERLQASTTVTRAAVVSALPIRLTNVDVSTDGYVHPPIGVGQDPDFGIWAVAVTPGYFDMLGVPIVRGRPFNNGDEDVASSSVIVGSSLAARLWPREDPIGRQFIMHPIGYRGQAWSLVDGRTRPLVVVGVVPDVVSRPGRRASLEVYVPLARDPTPRMFMLLDSDAPSAHVRREAETLFAEIAPTMAVVESTSLEEIYAVQLFVPRVSALLSTFLGGACLAAAAIGIFGVTALVMVERKFEMAVRVTLGATPNKLTALVMRDALVAIGVGIGVGAIGWSLGGPVLAKSSWIGQVYARDPSLPVGAGGVGLIAVAVLSAVSSLASYLPIRSALRTKPWDLLRGS